MKKISVIVPTYNEEKYIESAIHHIRKFLMDNQYNYEIIVVNDGSNDDTVLALNQYKLNESIKIYHKTTNQGKGAAIKTGWKIATGDYVAFMDADLQILPKELKTFLKLMDIFDADAVIGSKRHPYSNVDYPMDRRIISMGYKTIVKYLFGLNLRDTQVGFKLFKKEAIDKVMDRILVKRFAFDIELLLSLKINRFRIVEAPVTMTKPIGAGSVSMDNILKTFKDTMAVWYRHNVKKYYE